MVQPRTGGVFQRVIVMGVDDDNVLHPLHVGPDNELIVRLLNESTIDIGKVDQGTKGLPANAWPVALYAADGSVLIGQKNMAGSAPVTIASDQSAVSVSDATTHTSLTAIDGHVDGIEALLNGGLPAALSSGGGLKAGVVDALPAGSNIIGKVGIDQTTPGTTNAVADGGPAVAGTATYTTSADMTAVADIGPAPTSGQKSVLREVTISVDTAMNVTLQMQTTAGAERIKLYLPANGTVSLVFRHPRKLGTADKKWQAIASVVGNIAISTVTTSEA